MLSKSEILTAEKLNQKSKNVKYPIRGRLHFKALDLKRQLQLGHKKEFDYVVHLNYGDCHAFGQKPITFFRQVMSLCLMPNWMDRDDFSEDVKQRARHVLSGCNGGSVGSYSDFSGSDFLRQDIAKYIEERDGFPCNPKTVYVTAGATDAIKTLIEFLQTSADQKPAGFLIPVPTFSAYTASISITHSYPVGYYLDEDNDWGLSIDELQRAYDASLDKCIPRAICIINPGNPTGTVFTRENIQEIIKFAFERKLLIIADEVYQLNIYDENMKFHSFRKVAHEMGAPYNGMEIASMHSASKGFTGECGLRVGYIDFLNLNAEIQEYFSTYICTKSAATVVGQACFSALFNPPKENEPSYPLFKQETTKVMSDLKEKAELISKLFNGIEGITCNRISGSLYAFPRVFLPPKAIEHAKALNIEPDEFYCEELLEHTGLCVVPGSGFGQKPGTYHFRSTCIVPIEQLKASVSRFEKFHKSFIDTWK